MYRTEIRRSRRRKRFEEETQKGKFNHERFGSVHQ
jgi:hypothetical protein